MGQRSQIYVRYNGDIVVANYYQWNFRERMISRTRSILEYIKTNLDEGFNFKFMFDSEWDKETFRRFCDVNFDFKDIVRSSNIIIEYQEWVKDGSTEPRTFNDFVLLGQDNNNGKLFIDIVCDEDKNYSIKYALVNWDDYYKPLTATQYLNKECYCNNWKNCDYLDDEQKEYTKDNIKYIKGFSKMTVDELKDFLDSKYFEDGQKAKLDEKGDYDFSLNSDWHSPLEYYKYGIYDYETYVKKCKESQTFAYPKHQILLKTLDCYKKNSETLEAN